MPIGFILAFWPAFVAWLEFGSRLLVNRPGAPVSFYAWFILPTVVLAIVDIRLRGSLFNRKRAVASGFVLGVIVASVIFFPWGDLDKFRCAIDFMSCKYSWDELNQFTQGYTNAGAGLLLVLGPIEVVACGAWVIALLRRLRSGLRVPQPVPMPQRRAE